MDQQPHGHRHDLTAFARLNRSAGIASVCVAGFLATLKAWAVYQTGSISIAASLADSILDVIVSGGALLAMVYATRPADEDHAFGHTSAEDLASLVQAMFISASAAVILWSAAERILSGQSPALAAQGTGIAVMAVSITLTLALLAWQRSVARRTGSRLVAGDSLNYLVDLLPNAGVILSLWASRRWGITWLDSAVAVLAALILLRGASVIGKAAWDALMDRQADPALIAQIGQMAASWPGVRGYHDLKTRMAGNRVFVHLHIELDGSQTLSEAHAIGRALRRSILTTWPQCDVIIHKDVAPDT